MKHNKINCIYIFLSFVFLFYSCSNNIGEDKIMLNSVSFIDKNLIISTGQQKALQINYSPSNADVSDSDFKYECTPEDYLKIVKSDKSGCVIEAVKKGSGVVTVSSGAYSAYVQVDVQNPEFSASPYITLPFSDIKLNPGDRRTIISNIIGGNKENFSKMIWSSSESSVVDVSYTENTCILTAKKSGVSVIKCSAGGILYPAEMLAIVSDNNTDFFYISTSDNVINVKEGESKGLNISLEGGNENDYSTLTYTVTDGEDNISVSGSGGKYTVYGSKEGEALITFIHPKSKISVNVRVIINNKNYEGGINCDKDFIVLKENEREFIDFSIEGLEGGEWTYTVSEQNIVSVSHSGSHFVINAVKEGSCTISVYNSLCSTKYDIQVIVEKQKLNENCFIKTSQNIIKTETGFQDSELLIELLGGNESDVNGFTWTVSDSSIIDVQTNTGKVIYSRSVAQNGNDYIEGKCYIKPLNEGKASIEISHPKAENTLKVDVYVYKKGTFSKEYCILNCNTFVSVVSNEKEKFYLNCLNNISPSNLTVNVENPELISALYDDKGVIEIEGIGKGLTSFTIDADNFMHPVKIKVKVIDAGEKVNVIKTGIPFIELQQDSEKYIELNCSYKEDPIYEVQSSDPSVCTVKMASDYLCIKALKKGNAVIYISEKDADIITELYVYVLDSDLSENPYNIECNNYLKAYVNGEVILNAKIKNSNEYKFNFNYDSDYIRIREANNRIFVQGLKSGSTQIKISSNLSSEEICVNVFIYETLEEMDKYNFFYIKEDKIEEFKGNKKILKIYSSNNCIPDDLTVDVADTELIKIENEDDIVILKCIKSGITLIKISASSFVDLEIPVLIMEGESHILKDVFSIQPFIQGLINERIRVNLVLEGKYAEYRNMVKWIIPEVFKYDEITDGLILETDKTGEFEISCEIDGEIRKSDIIIYKDKSELENSTFISVPSTIYTINKDEVIEIIPAINSKTYTLDDITWDIDTENIINCSYENHKLIIKGLNEGSVNLTAKVNGCDSCNNCNISIFVKNQNFNNKYIDGPKIVSVKNNAGGYNFIIYENGKQSDNYSEISYSCNRTDCELNVTNNYLRFYAENTGYYIVSIDKNGYKGLRTLICNNIDLNINPVIFTDNEEIVLNVNEEREIEFYSSLENEKYLFSIKGDNVFSIINNEDGKVRIKGLKNGKSVLVCKTGSITKEININVINDLSDINISVEPVICIKKSEYYTTAVQCNKTVSFYCSDNELDINQNGNNCTLSSNSCGLYELKVYCNGEERIIIVYVYEENNDRQIFNIDKRNYYLNVGSSINIYPYILNGNTEDIKLTDLSSTYAQVSFENSVIKIKGTSEGVFNLILELNTQKIILTVYVSNNGILNSDKDIPVNFYMTTDIPYIKIEPEQNANINLYAVSYGEESFFDYDKIQWTVSNPDCVTLKPYSRFCNVKANTEGRYFIYAKSVQSSNVLVFTFDCTYENNTDSAYLYTEKKNIRMDYSQRSISFDVTLRNSSSNNSLITLVPDTNEYIKISKTEGNNCITVTADYIKPGTTCLKFSNKDCKNDLCVYINTVSQTVNDIPYLTTVQNYSVIKPGQLHKLEVELINYEELDSSNYRWRVIKGGNCISLIGSGNQIQVYGNNEGIGEIEVTHIPTNSKIELYVEVSRMVKNVKYITCEQSIVETNISSVLDFINLSVIGGNKEDINTFTCKCDDNSVVSILMDGPVLYYRGLKEGECLVTVENERAGCVNKINIRFIVTNKEDTQGIRLSDTAVSLVRNGSSKSVTAEIYGIDNCNYSNLEWYVYYQNGSKGDVISIVSSGNKCVIKPLEEGFARIRVCYLPTGFTASVGVYVDINGKFSFEKDNLTLIEGENTFIGINYPVWLDNPGDYVTYESLSPDIAKCFGTGRVCCIEAVSKGSCIIRAVNSFDGSTCETGITVNEKGKDSNRLCVSKNTYILNPRSADQIIKASVFGKELTDYDNTDIKWEIISDSSGSISLIPNQGSEVILRLKPCTDISDKEYGKVKSGEAIIKVTHDKCPDSEQRIYICINENQNFFTLDKYTLNMNVGGTADLSCNILNSKISDFDNVSWSVTGYNTDKYGNRVEVARLLSSSGRTCSLYALNEGVCTVSAFYFGNTIQCEVNVLADRVMRINGSSSIKMFPDIRDDNYIDISYLLRPSQNIPVWSVENLDKPSSTTVITIEEISGEQKIRVRPNGVEGKCKITGFAVGIGQVTVNVDVKFEPQLRLLEGDSKILIQMEDGGNNERLVKFLSYPAMYTVDAVIDGTYKDYVRTYVERESIVNDCKEGWLRIKVLKEFPIGGCSVVLTQYKDSGKTEVINSVNSKLVFNVSGAYRDSGFSLAYQRGRGSFINVSGSPATEEYDIDENFNKTTTNGQYKLIYDSTVPDSKADVINLADAEDHYFIIKSKHENSFMSNISVSIDIEKSKVEFKDNDIKSDEDKERLQGFMMQNKPVVSGIEQKSDGSYIFNIKTGEEINKYGLYWNQKERGKKENQPVDAHYKYSNRVRINVPYIKCDIGREMEEIPLYNFSYTKAKEDRKNTNFNFKDLVYKSNYFVFEASNIQRTYAAPLSNLVPHYYMSEKISTKSEMASLSGSATNNFIPLITQEQLLSCFPYELERIGGQEKWLECYLRKRTYNGLASSDSGNSYSLDYIKKRLELDMKSSSIIQTVNFKYNYYFDPYQQRYLCICAYDKDNEIKYKAFYMTANDQPEQSDRFAAENDSGGAIRTPALCGIYGKNFKDKYLDRHKKDGYIDIWDEGSTFTGQWDYVMPAYKDMTVSKDYPDKFNFSNDIKNTFLDNKITLGKVDKNPRLINHEDYKKYFTYYNPMEDIKKNEYNITYKDDYIILEIDKDFNFFVSDDDSKEASQLAAVLNYLMEDLNTEDRLTFINNMQKDYLYNNKVEEDFIISNIDLVVKWIDLNNAEQTKLFPMTLNFYRNYNDYYIYDDKNKLIGVNKNRINESIEKFIKYPQ